MCVGGGGENSKTLFYKDCIVDVIKTDRERERERERKGERAPYTQKEIIFKKIYI